MGDESRYFFDAMLDYDIDEYVFTINLGSEDDIDYDTDQDYHYKDEDGIEKSYPSIYEPNVRSRKNYFWGRNLIKKYIDPKKYQHHKISNLNITCIDAHHVNEKLIELAHKNIFLYSYPFAR